jgi:phosphonate transport system substrate-binding protein
VILQHGPGEHDRRIRAIGRKYPEAVEGLTAEEVVGRLVWGGGPRGTLARRSGNEAGTGVRPCRRRTPPARSPSGVGKRFTVRRRPAVVVGFLLILLTASAAVGEEFTIGLIPEQNVFLQKKRYEPIGTLIEARTGVKIRFTILSQYGNIIDAFTSQNLDGAFCGSFTAALGIEKLGIEPVARPVWRDGTSTYHGHLFVRKDSGIRNVADMKGKTIAFVDRATTAGYVFPIAYLREHGVRDIDSYFKEYYFAGSHDGPISAVLQREADVGCGKNTIFDIVAARDPRVRNELLILAESPEVPSNALAVRGDLDPAIREKLRETLLAMDGDSVGRSVLEEFGALRFIPTTKEDYSPVLEIAKKAGINLAEFVYPAE